LVGCEKGSREAGIKARRHSFMVNASAPRLSVSKNSRDGQPLCLLSLNMQLELIWNALSAHQQTDILYYLAFVVGQLLSVLRRADMATRSLTNPTPNRRTFIWRNWVPILIRSVLEFVFIFYPYREFDINTIISKFGWHLPFLIPQSVVVAFLFGFFSDALLDWLLTLQTFPGTTWPIPTWIKEQVPPLTSVSEKTVVQRTQTDEVTVTKTITPNPPVADTQEKKDAN
jgi:hypothetical protein